MTSVEPVEAQLIISEFRVRGPNGANDEFIEIYNNSGADHTVVAASGTGYGVAASDGTTRCSVPNGTVIPNRGHYLCVNSVGYSLASYPAGNGTTATGDATYTTDIPDNAGIALFNNNTGGGSYLLANRLDAVGSTSEANTLYKEGTGYPALTPFSIDYAFQRDECGKSGSITTMGVVHHQHAEGHQQQRRRLHLRRHPTARRPAPASAWARPVRRTSRRRSSATPRFAAALLDTCVVASVAAEPRPRLHQRSGQQLDVRHARPPPHASPTTPAATSPGLRYRVIDLTTFPAPSGIADLRPRTSTSRGRGHRAIARRAARARSNVTVQGTTLEQPPSQPNGSGFNGIDVRPARSRSPRRSPTAPASTCGS